MVQISINFGHSLSIIHIPRHAPIEARLHGQKEMGKGQALVGGQMQRPITRYESN
jgi:hypothetical protein